MCNMSTSKTVKLSDHNYNRLEQFAKWNDTVDEVVGRILDLAESKKEAKKVNTSSARASVV